MASARQLPLLLFLFGTLSFGASTSVQAQETGLLNLLFSPRKKSSSENERDQVNQEARARAGESARKLAIEEQARDFVNERRQEDRRNEMARDSAIASMSRDRQRTARAGIFGRLNQSRSRLLNQVPKQPDTYLYINEDKLDSLSPSNSRIEIDLSDQRARVYQGNTLVIETQVSTGRKGYTTPTGTYTIKEKTVDKQSGRYGTWFDAHGNKLEGDDFRDPPAGAVNFVGADMPYWLRITGGIGMHIGFVPNEPASHGCIRVPGRIQPLIYQKVKVGTKVRIRS